MEDILASIRRIIADDQSQIGKAGHGSGARRSQPGSALPSVIEADHPATSALAPYEDVLDLAQLAPLAEARGQQPADPAQVQSPSASTENENQLQEPASHHESQMEVAQRSNGYDPEDGASSLRARLSGAAAHGSLADPDLDGHDGLALAEGDALLAAPLGASVLSAFETLAATVVLENTPMLERVMRDLLRPMLKTWLDDNLPALVERLVRTEIERVARGGRN